ncbi:MAG: pyridoxamine 5'-phosphate oxidase family protein [Clostridia bacterium]|nr:pyridoxamine 5'-phosphate oxidase family protein [Clostridia bacterium]
MGMACRELSFLECLEVLRSTSLTRAAFTDGDAPYVVPMGFVLDAHGLMPVIRLCMASGGRKAACLAKRTRVCLEFESPGCAWADVVLLEGEAVTDLWDEECGGVLHVTAEALSGRRFFLPEA